MSDLFFSKEHLWIRVEGKTAQIGISTYAQERLGNVLFVNVPETGEILAEGKAFGDIESIKTVSDLISPCGGTVTAVNETVVDDPGILNENAMENWIVEASIECLSSELLSGKEYEEYLKTV